MTEDEKQYRYEFNIPNWVITIVVVLIGIFGVYVSGSSFGLNWYWTMHGHFYTPFLENWVIAMMVTVVGITALLLIHGARGRKE